MIYRIHRDEKWLWKLHGWKNGWRRKLPRRNRSDENSKRS
jgi:hypothetical protein